MTFLAHQGEELLFLLPVLVFLLAYRIAGRRESRDEPKGHEDREADSPS